MKVGTDGVLLGAWANQVNPIHVLDVGTGSGLIALMLAQRFTNAQVDAVELDDAAANEAQGNFESSIFSQQLTLHHSDYLSWSASKRYDLIVSNPPFFQSSLQSPSASRNLARHTETLPTAHLIKKSSELLTENGKLCLIFPADQFEFITRELGQNRLHIHRSCIVRNKQSSPVKRMLVEAGFGEHPPVHTELYLYQEDGSRSEGYVQLTSEFYL